jgi:hypothetical protein
MLTRARPKQASGGFLFVALGLEQKRKTQDFNRMSAGRREGRPILVWR